MHSHPTSEPSARTAHGPVASSNFGRLAGTTVLAVWAHPDDESYLGGGLMAAVAAAGGRVVNVSATLGEHGTPDPVTMPPETLASIRNGELSEALAALGVHESIVLGFEDGTLVDIEPELGARRIATVLDEVDPDLVVSFGPDGVTGHPDHIAVGDWTARAVAASPRRPALLQTAAGRIWPEDLVDALHEVNAFFPGFPHRDGSADDAAFLLGDDVLDAKLAALASHASQIGAVHERLGGSDYRRLSAIEAYRPANDAAWQLLTGSHPVVAA